MRYRGENLSQGKISRERGRKDKVFWEKSKGEKEFLEQGKILKLEGKKIRQGKKSPRSSWGKIFDKEKNLGQRNVLPEHFPGGWPAVSQETSPTPLVTSLTADCDVIWEDLTRRTCSQQNVIFGTCNLWKLYLLAGLVTLTSRDQPGVARRGRVACILTPPVTSLPSLYFATSLNL